MQQLHGFRLLGRVDKRQQLSLGRFAADEYQYWVWTGYGAKDPYGPALSPTVCKLLKIAKAAGCTYVRLDGDGPVYEDLPKFEW